MRSEDLEIRPKASLAEKLQAFREEIWALILPIIIIGGIRFGIFTLTEAAVVAAIYAILISVLIYRELKLKAFFNVNSQDHPIPVTLSFL